MRYKKKKKKESSKNWELLVLPNEKALCQCWHEYKRDVFEAKTP